MGDMASEMMKRKNNIQNLSENKFTQNEIKSKNILDNKDKVNTQHQNSSARKNDDKLKGDKNNTFKSYNTTTNAKKLNYNSIENKTDSGNSHTKNRSQNSGTNNISKDNESSTKSKYPNNIEEFGDKFVNPYNFISLGKEVKRREKGKEDFSDELLTGSISCTLRTKTPIFIPNITNDNALGLADLINEKKDEQDNKADGNKETNEKHKNYDFFSYNDLSGKVSLNEPKESIIPGSSIRGVIRSAFEALTDSCMMTSDRLITGRSKIINKAGIIEKTDDGKWILYEAEESKFRIKGDKCFKVNKLDNIKYIEINGKKYISYTKVRHKVDKRKKMAYDIGKYGGIEGFLVLGECDEEKSCKKYDYIFRFKDPKSEPIDVTNEVALLKKVLDVYNSSVNINLNTKENPTGYHYGYRNFNLDEKKIHPVWYNDSVPDKIYLAPACISRIAFNNTITEILKNSGGYNACSDTEKLCTACELFGMVGDKTSLGSKIRFSDAKLNKKNNNINNCYDDIMLLDELSNPKPVAVEFYTKRPTLRNKGKTIEAHSWNYDYSTLIEKKDTKKEVKAFELDGLEIIGRKFYWHSHSIKAQKYGECKDTESDFKATVLNTTVRPIKPEVEFSFNIYFERVTEEELKSLIWVLTIGENNINGIRCHKIGGAKPLGFGSVKVVVNEVKKRTWNIAEDGSIIRTYEPINLDKLLEKELFSGEIYEEFLKITNFNSMRGKNVQYPFGKELKANGEPTGLENDEGGHVWFRLNRLAKNRDSTELLDDIKFVLNGILSEDHELPLLLRKKP